MNKKLNIFAYAISIAGLMAELSALLPFSRETMFVFKEAAAMINALSLTFFRADFLHYHNFDSGMQLSYLSLTAHCLLLTGAIAWSVSKGKETRLVRAILALIVFQQVLSFVANIAVGVIEFNLYMNGPAIWIFLLVVSIIEHAALCHFIFQALKEYQQTRKLQNGVPVAVDSGAEPVSEAVASAGLVYAPLLKRFSNLVIDTFLCMFVLAPFGFWFQLFLGSLEEKFGSRTIIYVFFIIGRLIYYPFFETLFGATPAKLFTETRVVTDNNDKTPSFGIAMYRTLCRFIPFEPFSFLFSLNGWHDNLTNTRVVNEERTGVRLRIYGLIIPAIILVATTTYFAYKKFEKHKSYVYYKGRHDWKISQIKKQLTKLDTTSLIKLKNADQSYASEKFFLKVEEINGDQLTAYVIQISDNYTKSIREIENLYIRGKTSGFLSVVAIDRSDLDKAYTVDYDKSEEQDRNAVMFLKDNRRFEIEEIDRLFRPSIHDRGSGSQGGPTGSIYIDLLNYGWPARVVALESLEGTIKWPDVIDIEAPTVGEQDSPDFSVSGEGYKSGDHYKFRMTVRDSLGRDYTYIVDGSDMQKTVELVE